MKTFYPWFFTDDTPRWKRTVRRFLWVVTLLIVLAVLVWLLA